MRRRPLCSGCLILFLLITLATIMGGEKFIKELQPSILDNEIDGKVNVRLSGQVYDIDQKEKYQILYLNKNSIIYQNKSFKESKIIVYDEEKLNIEIGNQIEVYGEISFYEEERNPGNFNQKLYYQKQGIRMSLCAEKVAVLDESVDEIRNSLYEFRLQWKSMLYEMLGEVDGALLSAMLLAEKSGLDEDTKELYQANGVVHILAISGLHLSVIGIGLYKLFRRSSGSFLVGGIVGSSFLLLYIVMIGISVSVLRALIMYLFRVGADIVGRNYDSSTALSVAALATIIWEPLYVFDGGFWLSYGAVLAIILVLPMFAEFPFQGFWASVSINLITLPILLYYFYEVPCYSVILNMIIIPLMTVILLCGLLGSGMCVLFISDGLFGSGGIGGGLFWICEIIFQVYEKSCEMFLKLPYARIVAGQPEIWQIVLYYLCLFLFIVLWRYKRNMTLGILLIFSVALMILPIDEVTNRIKGKMSITMLDVSQGDGIFIRGPKGKTYLIDGGSSDVKQIGKYRMEPFLKSQGVRKINYVFISHGDSDHISGIIEMMERGDIGVAIETIVLPAKSVWNENLIELAKKAFENEIQVVTISEGEQLTEGMMTLTCLAPQDEFAKEVSVKESNAASMVLALKYGKFDMLFTGDVEEEGEEFLREGLIEKYSNVKWDILKVAHHGSKNSSSEMFLKVVQPEYALISAGRNNSYGHPHAETVERLKNVGSKVLSTQECGALRIETNGGRMRVEGYLKKGAVAKVDN